MKRLISAIAVSLLLSLTAFAKEADYTIVKDLQFRPAVSSECLLDVAYVPGKAERPVIVWFHGGGLTKGKHSCPKALKTEEGGFNHSQMSIPSHPLFIKWIKAREK